MIPVPFVLQLAFQPREGLGGSEPLFDSDHAELLHPGVTNRDCCDHPGVTPVCGGSFVPSLGLEPPPFLLESSSQQQLGAELGMESPQSRSRLLPAEPPGRILQTSLGSTPWDGIPPRIDRHGTIQSHPVPCKSQRRRRGRDLSQLVPSWRSGCAHLSLCQGLTFPSILLCSCLVYK